MDSPALTETEIGGIKIPKPQSNKYQSAVATATDAVKSDAVTMGHNSFRPDVYRVTEGYVS